MTGPLSSKVAVVTGAGRGIGRAIALRLARDGASLAITARTAVDLGTLREEAEALDSQAVAVVADATDRDEAKAVVAAAMAEWGRVDILVNNVGGRLDVDHDPYTCDDDVLIDHLTLNLVSGWWTTRAALPHMRQQGYGRIVNIGSGAAKRSGSAMAYTTAKHGVVGMTRALAAETARHGITVNCVCPGWTNTPHNSWPEIAERWGVTVEEALERAKSQNLQHRILEPEEVAAMVALLSSDDGAGITGQVIGVDGGFGV